MGRHGGLVGVLIDGVRVEFSSTPVNGMIRIPITPTRNSTITFEYGPEGGGTLPINTRATNVVFSGTAHGGRYTVFRNSNRSLTVRGRLTTPQGQAVTNAEIIVIAYNPRAPFGATRRRDSGVIRTDNNGNFTATFTPNVASSSFLGDRGYIRIRDAATENIRLFDHVVWFEFFN